MPIVMFNHPSFEIDDQDHAGFQNNPYFFACKCCPNHTVYKLILNNVRSKNAIRQSTLKIAFSIPKGYALSDGLTPYDVLIRLKDEFAEKCLQMRDTTYSAYEFTTNDVNPHLLDETLQSIPLVPQATAHRPFTGENMAFVQADEQTIRQILSDVNYPEFQNYSEILLAETVTDSLYVSIKGLQVPRPEKFEIFLDGIPQRIVTDKAETVQVDPQTDGRYFTTAPACFTMQELVSGKSFPGVLFQPELERVLVTSEQLVTPKQFTLRLQLIPDELRKAIAPNELSVTSLTDGSLLPLPYDGSIVLTGNQLAWLENGFQVTSLRKDIKVVRSWLNRDTLCVELAPVVIPSPDSTDSSIASSQQWKDHHTPDTPQNSLEKIFAKHKNLILTGILTLVIALAGLFGLSLYLDHTKKSAEITTEPSHTEKERRKQPINLDHEKVRFDKQKEVQFEDIERVWEQIAEDSLKYQKDYLKSYEYFKNYLDFIRYIHDGKFEELLKDGKFDKERFGFSAEMDSLINEMLEHSAVLNDCRDELMNVKSIIELHDLYTKSKQQNPLGTPEEKQASATSEQLEKYYKKDRNLFACNLCQTDKMRFSQYKDLRGHLASIHFICVKCGFQCKNHEKLTQHKKSKHSSGK